MTIPDGRSRVRISGGFYAGILVLLAFGWPYLLFEPLADHQLFVWLLLIVNIGLAALVRFYTTSITISFFHGFSLIASSMMSGCANITLLYVPPVLAVIYLEAVIQTLIGLSRGRVYTQVWWVRRVSGFVRSA